jgi:hypothetical protein
MKRAVSVGIAAVAVTAVLAGAAAVQGAEGLVPTMMDESALLDAAAFGVPGRPLAGPSEDLFLAAVASSHQSGAGAQWRGSANVPLEADTIHYRVCKDLSICFVAVPTPPVGIAPPLVLPPVVTMALTPVPVPEAPFVPPAVHGGGVPWALAAIPLIGGGFALLDHHHKPSTGGEQPGGGGEQPGGGGEQPGGGGEQPGGGGEQPGGGGEQPGGGGGETPGTVTPEPWSVFLFGTGLAGVLVAYRRREGFEAISRGPRPGEPMA